MEFGDGEEEEEEEDDDEELEDVGFSRDEGMEEKEDKE